MSKRVAVLLAEGFEELEAVTVVDVLRRAGCDVRILSASGAENVRSAHAVVVGADALLEQEAGSQFDLVVCPGGMPGATNLAESATARDLLVRTWERGGLVAAVCAGPLALHAAGLLKARRFTVYPGNESKIDGGTWTGADVEEDERVVTSRGPGTALAFAFRLVELLVGADMAAELRRRMLIQ